MSGPWEKYQSAAPAEPGPWTKYAATTPPAEQPRPDKPGFLQGFKEYALDPLAAVGGAFEGLMHGNPMPTAELGKAVYNSAVTRPGEYLQKTVKAGMSGDPVGMTRNLPGIVPMFGPIAEDMTDNVARGEYGRAAGNLAGIAAGEGAMRLPGAASSAAARVVEPVKTVATEVLGKTTGVGADALRRAAEKPTPELVDAMRGNLEPTELVNNFREAVGNVKDARSQAYQSQMAKLPKQEIPGAITPIRDAMMKALDRFNVKVTPDGLDFSRSTLTDAAAKSAVESMANDVLGWGSKPGDYTPQGLDVLKRRIDNLYSENGRARALTQSVKDATRASLNRNVPGYSEMTRGYAEASDFLSQLSDLSVDSKNPGTAVRKITTLLNQNNGYRQALTERLSQYSPQDLEGQVAGLALSKKAPRGIAGAGSGAGLAYAVATHALHPSAAIGLAMTSPRLMGELMVVLSKVKPSGGFNAPASTLVPTSLLRDPNQNQQ